MKNILDYLINKGEMISFAESMTGGRISAEFVKHKNASRAYNVGFVVYSNEAKIKHLDIPETVINEFGVVSNEVAGLMAQNLHIKTGADLCISVTGYADSQDPNIAYIGVYYNRLLYVESIVFYPEDSREQNIKLTVKKSVKMLKEILKI
jgi:nicotinamide-nucleotide amidase